LKIEKLNLNLIYRSVVVGSRSLTDGSNIARLKRCLVPVLTAPIGGMGNSVISIPDSEYSVL